MNFDGFPGSHKAMRSIHLNTVTKLYHRFMTWYTISPPFKRSLTHSPLLQTFSFLLERKKSSISHHRPLSGLPWDVARLKCHYWLKSECPTFKNHFYLGDKKFSKPPPALLGCLLCLLYVCLLSTIYSPNINCMSDSVLGTTTYGPLNF